MLSSSVHSEMASDPRTPEMRAGETAFRLAEPSDDAAIRALLRGQAMAGGGRVRLSVETEPSFMQATALLGEHVEVLVATRPGDSRVIGLGVRAVRRVWLDGHLQRIGHLSFLRVHPDFRRRRDFLRGGYDLLRMLHERDPVVCHLTAILKDNVAARRVLEAGHRGLPRYAPLTDVVTFTLRSKARGSGRVDAPSDLPEFLRRTLSRQPFAPGDEVGPSAGNFVAVRISGRITGAAQLVGSAISAPDDHRL